ncbi:AcrR family transcriptional regulator [Saccharothrix ecbatanensis]|uniref:AcrR family transcriptional regulator n=1 Tax=Saccharothrix ecbatanensis TaxID=1105145 RepID=A0A7W9M5J3_9PSEU|nr:TetR family transcriptional regulator [Saccharothrix ecbatanensis]MBB5808256.1 AcrR family transcriptional regulator [Saccharothrix ecbatanensis]
MSRPRDAAATKAALLDAATKLFGERGFDRTTVRDIANLAGVNQALLFRYYGSKDALFATVLATQSRELLEDSPAEHLLRTVLLRMLEKQPRREDHPLYAVLRSSHHDSAADVVRRQLGEEYARALASLTDAQDAELRADLVLAWVVGIGVLRTVFGKQPLAGADSAEVAALVIRAAAVLLEHTDVG